MYHRLVKIVVLTTLLLCVFAQNETELRTIYITSDNSSSQITSCPVDHCYSLQDVFNNQSYIFDSYTMLELLPGSYDITERVGQLVIANVRNFTFKGSSLMKGDVTITCLPGATFGFAFILSHNVEISNIQISYCSAKLNLSSTLLRTINRVYDNILIRKHLEHDFESCNAKSEQHILCFSFFASFRNTNVTIHQTSIVYSRGVGVYMYNNSDFDISNIFLAHNEINCMIFIADAGNTYSSLSDIKIMSGQIIANSFNLSSGLNLFVEVMGREHDVIITNITLANNRAPYGNFYMSVYFYESTSININILIDAMTSIQTEELMPGMVVKYYILLERDKTRRSNSCDGNSILRPWDFFSPSYSILDRLLHKKLIEGSTPSKHREVNIAVENSKFIGSCVTVQDSQDLTENGNFSFNINNIRISESKCSAAIAVVKSDTNSIQLSNVTIINSEHNILSISDTSGVLEFSGNTSILSNQGSASVVKGKILFKGYVKISGNTAHQYESILHVSDSSTVTFHGETIFTNNTGRQGGAIFAYSHSSLEFEGNASFVGNSAEDGGAINLKERSLIHLKGDTRILFRKNRAKTYGGAIYVEDAGFWINQKKFSIICFISCDTKSGRVCNVEFESNKAGKAGSALFGGWINICNTNNGEKPHHFLEFKAKNSVASNPTRVCICRNSTINKYETETHIQVFPGQTFELEVIAVGQRFGIVPTTVRAEMGSNLIDSIQKLQDTDKECTNLKYTIRSSNINETMVLRVDRQDIPQNETVTNELLQFRVLIHVKACPAGFVFESKQNICLCHQYLLDQGIQCNFNSYTVNRNAQQWIGLMRPTMDIVIHHHCPSDYCKSHALFLNLSNPDDQCSFSRSGVLCGACRPGLSHVLGTSNCKKCSNSWLSLTLIFTLAGVILVVGLMLLNLTVTEGTINGLIFYANIVRANTAVFFPGEGANSFLSWFIAWLNLDVGVETCFYDGLDAYVKTWLQFVFPFYIWLMVAFIITCSKHSIRAARVCRKNAVQVLATLFLLSYAKLLRVTITVFQPTHLAESHTVWHYDGNIFYLGKRHAPLMTAALLLFVLFFIPYTLILFGIQWLQALSHYKLFGWVNKFKPLFDAYTGPYKDKHRYWTGLLLLVRIGLFTVFSTNTSGDPAINLLAIIVVITCLFAYLALFATGIYKVWLVNVLEYSFLLNLIILSASVLYATSVDKPVHLMTQVSVGITLSITAIIIIYHSLHVILRMVKAHTNIKITNIWKKKMDNNLEINNDNNLKAVNIAALDNKVTHSVVELTEPLIN